jgi:hypothetical protein
MQSHGTRITTSLLLIIGLVAVSNSVLPAVVLRFAWVCG